MGKSLAEMIRKNKVHAITCTGANLEEDVFNLVANKHYKRVPRGFEVDSPCLILGSLPPCQGLRS
jgi:deoxyhypusine synthase